MRITASTILLAMIVCSLFWYKTYATENAFENAYVVAVEQAQSGYETMLDNVYELVENTSTRVASYEWNENMYNATNFEILNEIAMLDVVSTVYLVNSDGAGVTANGETTSIRIEDSNIYERGYVVSVLEGLIILSLPLTEQNYCISIIFNESVMLNLLSASYTDDINNIFIIEPNGKILLAYNPLYNKVSNFFDAVVLSDTNHKFMNSYEGYTSIDSCDAIIDGVEVAISAIAVENVNNMMYVSTVQRADVPSDSNTAVILVLLILNSIMIYVVVQLLSNPNDSNGNGQEEEVLVENFSTDEQEQQQVSNIANESINENTRWSLILDAE